MTIKDTKEAIDRLIQVAEAQVGYLEKKSNKDLDKKIANAGSANYTKYNRDLKKWTGVGSIDAQWCQAFVDWCFIEAFGLAGAKKLLYVFTNYTPTGSNAFKKRGRYIKRGGGKPKRGDVIYFYSSAKGRIGHVGIVYKVTSKTVYTIEGNTSGASTLVTNGGGVRKKSYSLTSTYIDGYGSVDYSAIVGKDYEVPDNVPVDLGDRVLKNGMSGPDVQELQNDLIKLGYDCGKWGADGDFGDATEMALRNFQTQHDLKPTGMLDSETMYALTDDLEALGKPVEDAQYVKIVGGNCYVRESPTKNSDPRGIAHEGTRLKYAGQTSPDGWLAVIYKDRMGWVSGKYGRLVV